MHLRHRPRTLRLRLTAIYGTLFLVSGAGLLTITYLLFQHATAGNYSYNGRNNIAISYMAGPHTLHSGEASGIQQSNSGVAKTLTPPQAEAEAHQAEILATKEHDHELQQLLVQSGIALAVMAAVSIQLGWLVAGRVLRPLRTITETAQSISAASLHERLALTGPDDELKRLGDTIDNLLARLEGAFDSQRHFVANASHELRTPLTVIRALLQMVLTDPGANLESFRSACLEIMAESAQQERLIEALLVLARSERGLDHREPLDLAALTDETLQARKPEADRLGLQINATIDPAEIDGDARLVERLAANLIDNALRHNRKGGHVEITTGGRSLTVTNTGPVVPPEQVQRLLQPFRRLGPDSTDHSDGLGLGLSIVQAIATAHHATLTVQAQPGGGLRIGVAFP